MDAQEAAGLYTYRIRWSEPLLEYVIDCDEYTPHYVRHADAEYLLDYTRNTVRENTARNHEDGLPVPRPERPRQSAGITGRCLERAVMLAAGHTPADSRTGGFRPWEREVLGIAAGLGEEDWTMSRDMVELSDAKLRTRLDDTFIMLHAMLIAGSAEALAQGDMGQAEALDRARLALGESYLGIGPHDRRKMIACTDRYLHLIARRALGLGFQPDVHIPPDKATAMRLLAANPRFRYAGLRRATRRRHPWAGPLADMPRGWMIRFGPELMDDMQQVIDLGLRVFGIDQVKEKWGGLRVLFDDDPIDWTTGLERPARWMDLAGLMRELLDLYETLSTCTCIRCGSQYLVRASAGRWIEPVCRRCAHARATGRRGAPPAKSEWKRMRPLDCGEPLAAWADGNHARLLGDGRLRGLHIRTLLEQCDREQAGYADTGNETPENHGPDETQDRTIGRKDS